MDPSPAPFSPSSPEDDLGPPPPEDDPEFHLSNNVATLDTPFADPDAESMRLRLNELVLALRRT